MLKISLVRRKGNQLGQTIGQKLVPPPRRLPFFPGIVRYSPHEAASTVIRCYTGEADALTISSR